MSARRIPLAFAGTIAGITVARAVSKKLNVAKWDRQHRDGSAVSLFGGLETALGVLGAGASLSHTRIGLASLIASAAGGIAGWVDDHCEASFPAVGKGFRGHLGALRKGRLTSGMVKIVLIGTGAAVSALLLEAKRKDFSLDEQKSFSQIVRKIGNSGINTVIIAGTANFLNLLDLRPGRALKAGILLTSAVLPKVDLTTRALGTGVITASLINLPKDLSGENMLGDLGANALGGAIGVLLVDFADSTIHRKSAKLAVTLALVALTALSEKISFSQIIENTPILRELDQFGR